VDYFRFKYWINIRQFIWLILLPFIPIQSISAQSTKYERPSKVINRSNGLPDEYIMSMTQDSMGFIWIGTSNGLVRFDGTESRVWQQDEADSLSLNSSWITDLEYDHYRNRIWLGTAFGLNFLDLKSGEIYSIKNDPSNHFDINKNWIEGLFLDSDHNLWIFDNNFHLLDLKTGRCESFKNSFADGSDLIISMENDIIEKDIVWLNTFAGVIKFNISSKSFEEHLFYKNKDKLLEKKLNQGRYCLYQHDDGRIFSCIENGGLVAHDKKSKSSHIVSPIWNGKELRKNLKYKSIVRLNHDHLIFFTDIGRFIYKVSTNKIIEYFDDNNYSQKTVAPSLMDNMNRIWISSILGIEVYDPQSIQIESIEFERNNLKEHILVNELIEDTKEKTLLFCQREGQFLYQFDLVKHQLLPPIDILKETDLRDLEDDKARIVDLKVNHEGKVLILMEDILYEYSENKWSKIIELPKLKTPPYISFTEHSNSDLIFTTNYEGIVRLSEEYSKIDRYHKGYLNDPGHWLLDGFSDNQNKYWINQLNVGFIKMDFKKDESEIFDWGKELGRTNLITRDQAWINDTSLLVALGTMGLGLVHRDHSNSGPSKIYKSGQKGLTSNKVYSIESDQEGNYWMLGELGLIKFDPQLDSFYYYSYPNNKYNIKNEVDYQMTFKSISDGRMVFGFGQGLAFFNPKEISSNKEIIHPIITKIGINNRQYDIFESKDTALTLKHFENNLTFDFSSISHTRSENNIYKYRLAGLEDQWNYSSASNRQIKYSNLDNGSYSFQLFASNSDGIWSTKPANLKLVILSPWWESWWAIIAYCLIGGFVARIWYTQRKKKWLLQSEIQIQKQRTKTIVAQKNVELLNALIRGEETERSRLSRELHDGVGAMIAAIKMYFHSMEHKSPQLDIDPLFKKTRTLVSDTYDEVRNISHNLMPVNIQHQTLNMAIEELCDFYSSSGDIKISFNSTIENNIDLPEVKVNLYRITQEIFRNIISHAQANQIMVELKKSQNSILLIIENDGKVFNFNNNLESTGIGLKNIMHRVEFIKGELKVSRNLNQRMNYVISVPLSR